MSPVGRISLGGPISPDGSVEVTVDLPLDQRIRNIGSRVDGAGMCVMSSVEMAARWANLRHLRGLRDWCAREAGGAWPEKVDRQLRAYAQQNNLQVPRYVNYVGASPEILEAALATGRMPAVTYSGRDNVRYSRSIAHMVNLVHLDANWAAILDNNGIGEQELIWMSRQEFLERWRDNRGSGWAVIWLAYPPPPPPVN